MGPFFLACGCLTPSLEEVYLNLGLLLILPSVGLALVGLMFASSKSSKVRSIGAGIGWLGIIVTLLLDVLSIASYSLSLIEAGVAIFYSGFASVIPISCSCIVIRSNLRTVGSSYPLCNICGYNLTGNVSGICPECGTTIVGQATV